MIKPICFTKEWVDGFRQQPHFKRINPPVLEKMIHALSLLQQLRHHGLDFIFKGGTSLVLLLDQARRFSVDIDIITTEERSRVEEILNKVIETSHFHHWNLQDKRSYQEGVPKAHYEFDYTSQLNPNAHTILLDILFEEADYPRTNVVPIQTEWVDSETAITVTVPSVESILGDKLTAFAPNTVGILYGKGKEQEIMKQLFDIACLFDKAEDVGEIAESFQKIGSKEIRYRGLDITLDDILDDILHTSLLIARREKNKQEPESSHFKHLQLGIRQFESFLIAENFKIEEAILAAGKAAYLAVRLKNKDYSHIERYDKQDIGKLEIAGELNFLNRLKKSKDKSAFFYWHQAIKGLPV